MSVEKVAMAYEKAYENIIREQVKEAYAVNGYLPPGFEDALTEMEKEAILAQAGQMIGAGVKTLGLAGARAGKQLIRSGGGYKANTLSSGAGRLLHSAGTEMARAPKAVSSYLAKSAPSGSVAQPAKKLLRHTVPMLTGPTQ